VSEAVIEPRTKDSPYALPASSLRLPFLNNSAQSLEGQLADSGKLSGSCL